MLYPKSLFPFESKWIKIGNEQIHYVDEGKGQVLLFSHAPLGSSFMYRSFIKQLSHRYRCIALDFPGFGASPGQDHLTYSITSQSIVLKEFIARLDLSNVIGFGHDTGGPTLAKVACDHPEYFDALIFSDTLLFPVREYPKVNRMLKMVGSSVFQALNAYTNLLVRLTFTIGIRTRNLAKEERLIYHKMFDQPRKRRRITQLLRSLREEHETMAQIQKLFSQAHHQLPVLLIYGEDDPISKMGVADRMVQSLPNSTLFLVEGEGHFPHEGQPDKMIDMVEQWLSQPTQNASIGLTIPSNMHTDYAMANGREAQIIRK